MEDWIGKLLVGGCFLVVGLFLVFGCRAGARFLAFRDRSSSMYRWYSMTGVSDQNPYGLALMLVVIGLFAGFIGFAVVYTGLTEAR